MLKIEIRNRTTDHVAFPRSSVARTSEFQHFSVSALQHFRQRGIPWRPCWNVSGLALMIRVGLESALVLRGAMTTP
jgi:hypothetical protein